MVDIFLLASFLFFQIIVCSFFLFGLVRAARSSFFFWLFVACGFGSDGLGLCPAPELWDFRVRAEELWCLVLDTTRACCFPVLFAGLF